VGDGRLLFSLRGPADTGLGRVRTVIQAGRGEVTRYHEADDDFRALSTALGDRSWVWYHGGLERDDQPETVERSGTAFLATSDAVYFFQGYLFESQSAVDTGAVKSALRDRDRPLQSERTDIETEGRVALAEIHLTHEKWRALEDDDRTELPVVTWIPRADDGVVQFEHAGGEPVDAGRLSVRGGDPEAASIPAGTVRTGDAVSVDLAEWSGTDVRLWYDLGGGSGGVLASHDPEEGST